jgi:hypothetical protein
LPKKTDWDGGLEILGLPHALTMILPVNLWGCCKTLGSPQKLTLMLVLKKWNYKSQQLIVTLSHKLWDATETDSDVSGEITTVLDTTSRTSEDECKW